MAELTRNLAINKDLNKSEISAPVGQYFQLANQWANLAGNALRFTNPVSDRLKMMLNSQYQADRQNIFATDETINQRVECFSSRDNFPAKLDIRAAQQLRNLPRRLRRLTRHNTVMRGTDENINPRWKKVLGHRPG
ncbi:MAG: hypothetical protein K0B06_04795 [Brevefilum sp.]|nr:hypothetical protein [Brevefilum sp.]